MSDVTVQLPGGSGSRVEWVGAGAVDGRLGRSVIWHDEASRAYPARGVLFDPDYMLESKLWLRPGPYNQGNAPQCVAYSVKGVCNTVPVDAGLDQVVREGIDPKVVYDLAQTLDPWPGTAYAGTSTLAGFKAAAQLGFIPGYRWCFGVQDVLHTLHQYGPVAIGVTWWESMFHPGLNGLLTVDKSAGNSGGHCMELHGVDVEEQVVVGTNSWGGAWGAGGMFRLRFEDLDLLLREDGEAATVAASVVPEDATR